VSQANVGDLAVNLSLDDAGYTVTVRKAGQVTDQFTKQLNVAAGAAGKLETAHANLGTGFRHFMILVASARFALMDINDVFLSLPQSVMKVSGEFERMTRLMEGLSTASTDMGRKLEAQQGFKFIMEMAQKAPFDIKTLQDAFIKLKSAGIDPMQGSMQALIDSVAKFGGNSETVHRAAIALQQMAGKGVVSMEELRQQLGEAIPNAMEMFAHASGMSIAEFTKHVSKGQVEANAAIRRFATLAQIDNQGAAEKLMDTWSGIMQQIQTQFMVLGKEVGDAGFFAEVKGQAQELLGFLKSSEGAQFARDIGSGLTSAVRTIADFTHGLIEMRDQLKVAAEILLGLWVAQKIAAAASNSQILAFYAQQQTALTAFAAVRQKATIEDNALEMQGHLQKVANTQAEFERKSNLAKVWEAEYAAHLARIASLDARAATAKNVGLAPQALGGFQQRIDLERAAAFSALSRAQANGQLAKSAEEVLQKEREHTIVLGNMHDKLEQAAGKITILDRAMGLWKGTIAALGGPLGAIITALSIIIPLWMEWGNKGAEAIKKVQDAMNSGTASRDDKKVAESKIAELQANITAAERNAEFARSQGDSTNARVFQEEADKYRAELQEWQFNIRRISKQIMDGDARQGALDAADALDKKNASILSMHRTKIAELGQKIKAVQEDPSITDAARKAQVNALIAAQNQERQAVAAEEHSAALSDLSTYQQQLREFNRLKVDVHSKEYQKLLGAIKTAEERVDSTSKLQTSAADLGKITFAQGKNQKLAPEDPMLKALERAQGNLDAAKEKLADIEDGAVSFDALYKSALAKIEATRKSGGFNFKDADGNAIDRRGKASDKFAAQEEELARRQAMTEASTRNAKGLEQATRALLTSKDELEVAEDQLAAGGDKTTGAYDRQKKQLDKVRASMVDVDGAFAKFDATSNKVLSNLARADMDNFISTLVKSNDELSAAAITNERDRNAAAERAYEDSLMARFNAYKRHLEAVRKDGDDTDVEILKAWVQLQQNLALSENAFLRKNRTALDQLVDQWKDTTKQIEDMQAKWADDFINLLTDATETGKLDWKKMVESWLMDLLKLELKKNLADPLKTAIGSIFDYIKGLGFMGLGGGGSLGAPGGPSFGSDGGGIPSFANGGVMSKMGKMSLNRYANGGIANSPQMAMFGEGRTPEAYVPLPDGRSIPVTMNSAPANVVVNVINQSGTPVQAEQRGPRFDGQQMVLDIVLSAASRPGGFRDGLRSAVR
jgi:tape measure domain-containing protein